MRTENGNPITDAGHDSQAMELLALALIPHVDGPMQALKVAADVFATLHDAGIRLVPSP